MEGLTIYVVRLQKNCFVSAEIWEICFPEQENNIFDIVSLQNIVSRPQIDFSLTSFQNHFAKNLIYLVSTMTC